MSDPSPARYEARQIGPASRAVPAWGIYDTFDQSFVTSLDGDGGQFATKGAAISATARYNRAYNAGRAPE